MITPPIFVKYFGLALKNKCNLKNPPGYPGGFLQYFSNQRNEKGISFVPSSGISLRLSFNFSSVFTIASEARSI